MEFEEFAIPRFGGGRFDKHVLPVDVLPDLVAYRELIVRVARELYLQKVGDRERVPKGFRDSFDLALQQVRGGNSADAVLVRKLGGQPALLPYDIFGEAHNLVEQVIEASNVGSALPSHFPPHLLSMFKKFGRGLKDDEFIEIGRPNQRRVRLSRQTRQRLLVARFSFYEEAIEIIADVDGGSVADKVIRLKLDDGRVIEAPVKDSDAEIREMIRRAGETAFVVGVGVFDQSQKLTRFSEVNDLFFVSHWEPRASIEEQIAELAALEAGWYDAKSKPLDPNLLRFASDVLKAVMTVLDHPRPFLYAAPDGGVRVEWSMGNEFEISLDIPPSLDLGYLHALKLSDGNDQEKSVDLSGETKRVSLEIVHFIKSLEE